MVCLSKIRIYVSHTEMLPSVTMLFSAFCVHIGLGIKLHLKYVLPPKYGPDSNIRTSVYMHDVSRKFSVRIHEPLVLNSLSTNLWNDEGG